jgi:hypothetical protein
MTTVNLTSYYIFGSPRYNVATTYPTILIPENYEYYTGLNGTYDKYFPLFKLTESSEPLLDLVSANASTSPIKGDLSIRVNNYKALTTTFGAIKGSAEKPFNSNLEKKSVSYSYWAHTRLNPAWCVIQNKQDNSDPQNIQYIPQLLVRTLGNNAVLSNIHAVDLDTLQPTTTWKSSEFPIGMIVKYKENLWRCKKATRTNPPEKSLKNGQTNSEWDYLNLNDNVFNADLFALTEDGTSGYMFEVKDNHRKFNPILANKDNDLVCWNLSYYHGN